jgi:hypothetical protein
MKRTVFFVIPPPSARKMQLFMVLDSLNLEFHVE